MTLTLIDLHRALIKDNLSKRWIVKDIGSLLFSAHDIGLTRNDKLRFMKTYSGKSLRLTVQKDKKFWHQVRARADALQSKVS